MAAAGTKRPFDSMVGMGQGGFPGAMGPAVKKVFPGAGMGGGFGPFGMGAYGMGGMPGMSPMAAGMGAFGMSSMAPGTMMGMVSARRSQPAGVRWHGELQLLLLHP